MDVITVITLLIVIISQITLHQTAQVTEQSEVNSLVWLYNVFGEVITANVSSGQCDANQNGPTRCSLYSDGQYHYFDVSVSSSGLIPPQPDTTIVLNGTKMEDISISGTSLYSINIFNHLKQINFPSLGYLTYNSDPNFLSIPYGTDFPALGSLKLNNMPNLTDISGFFDTPARRNKLWNLQIANSPKVVWNLTDLVSNFTDVFPNLIALNIVGGTNIKGILSPTLCKWKLGNSYALKISNSGVTLSDIPTCYTCYINAVNATKYPDFIVSNFGIPFTPCTPTFDQPFYPITPQTQYITVTGQNLGWGPLIGSDPRIITITPNFNLLINITGISSPYTLQLSSGGISTTLKFGLTTFQVTNLTTVQSPNQVQLNLILTYNNNITHNITIGGVLCGNVVQLSNSYSCIYPKSLSPGEFNYTLSNGYSNATLKAQFNQNYPFISSISSIDNFGMNNITMIGSFGQQTGSQVLIGSSGLNCLISFINSTTIICATDTSSLPVSTQGNTIPVYVKVDGFGYNDTNILYVRVTDTVLKCNIQTSNCNGHGSCNENGICMCNTGYSGESCSDLPSDIPIEFQYNTTQPTISFTHQDFKFNFTLVTIQEIGLSGQVVDNIPTTDSWLVTNTTSSDKLLINYQYKLLISNTTYTIAQPNLIVTVNITFSQKAYTVQYGKQILSFNPNSLKIGISIDNYQYQTSLNNLRVVFSTPISNSQSSTDECGNPTNPFQTSNQNTLNYLKIYKGNSIYYGRFLDTVISDGRDTYSKAQIISSNDKESTLIGIELPHCIKRCLLDPDFSALVAPDKSKCEDKSNSNSTSDKLKLGLIIGLVGGAAVICVSAFVYRKRKAIKLKYLDWVSQKEKNNIKMENK